MKNAFFFTLGLIFLVGSMFIFLSQPASPRFQEGNQKSTEEISIQAGETLIYAEVADDQAERSLGLSGRGSLADGKGVLFVFDRSGRHGIWMKDMKFSIDIAWMDEEKRIIWIENRVSPDTFPEVFYPSDPAKYVLEVPAGFFTKNFVDIGDILSW